jgi:precorrin-2/cobalt-factor-2 C20-methyltransferase
MSAGTLYGVGVGPGDPELMTLKAARIIAAAPVVAYPLANGGDSLARSIAAGVIGPDVHRASRRGADVPRTRTGAGRL